MTLNKIQEACKQPMKFLLSEEGKRRDRKSKASRKKQQKRKIRNMMEKELAVSFTSQHSPLQLLFFFFPFFCYPVDLCQHFKAAQICRFWLFRTSRLTLLTLEQSAFMLPLHIRGIIIYDILSLMCLINKLGNKMEEELTKFV